MAAGTTRARNVEERKASETIAELLSDFPSFCALLEIKNVTGKGAFPFCWSRWHPEQKRFERERTGRDIIIKPRQVGFSTMELARDLWCAITRRGYQVLVVTHDDELKKGMFLVVRMFAEALKKRGLLPKTRYSTTTEIVFAETGSAVRIVEAGKTESAANDKGRSGTVHRLHATEMAFWGQAETTWGAVHPAVPDDGEIVIESTANGAGGLYYQMIQEARQGLGGYKFHFFPWFEQRRYVAPLQPGFDPAPRDKWEQKLRAAGCSDQQIQWWRIKFHSVEMGPEKTLRDFPVDADSCFRSSGRPFFEPDLIDWLMEMVSEPIERRPLLHELKRFGELRIYERPVRGARYIVGGDVSEGTGSDSSAIVVIERRSARVVAAFDSDSLEPGDFGLAMVAAGELYNRAVVAPERNNHGHAALRAIQTEAHYGNVYMHRDDKRGWLTDAVTRPVMVDDLGGSIRSSSVWTPDRTMALECKTLVHNDKGKVEARDKGKKGGCKDDLWMAWCIAFQVRSQPEFAYQAVKIPGL